MTSANLILGDCVEAMARLPEASIDLTVTSPPYDNLRTYNGSLNDWNAAKWQAVIAGLYRVTKPGGVVVWVVGDATIKGSETGTSFRQALYAMECGFRLHDTMIWAKANGGAVGSNLTYTQNTEFMFVWSKGRPATINLIRDRRNASAGQIRNPNRRKVTGERKSSPPIQIAACGRRNNWWIVPPENKSQGHPAPFPEALARDHILSWSNPGDVVLDPFLGSGTTAKMALALGRRCIGIERDPSYFAIAQERVQPGLTQFLEAAE